MKIQLVKALLMVSFFMLGACSIRDAQSIKSTKEFYFTHVNKPATLELENIDNLTEDEYALALRFAKLDKELTSLARAMDSVLEPTDQGQVSILLNTFPWLSNVYVLDENANILGAIPSAVPAFISFSYLTDLEVKPRELYSEIISNEGGATFLMARPYIQSGILVGYLAASFDPRSLLPLVGDASNVFIRTPDDILWSGDLYLPDTPLADVDWARTLDHSSSGKISSQGLTATWFGRYYAHMPMIFGIVESQEK